MLGAADIPHPTPPPPPQKKKKVKKNTKKTQSHDPPHLEPLILLKPRPEVEATCADPAAGSVILLEPLGLQKDARGP